MAFERGIRGVLSFGSIDDGCVLVGGKLKILGIGVIPLEAELGDVVVRGKATGALGVVPLDIDGDVQVNSQFSVVSYWSLRAYRRWWAWRSLTYSTPKSSMMRVKRIGRHLWRQRPGVVVHW